MNSISNIRVKCPMKMKMKMKMDVEKRAMKQHTRFVLLMKNMGFETGSGIGSVTAAALHSGADSASGPWPKWGVCG
jgi:hypothetical protein